VLGPGVAVAEHDREVEGQPRDVGKGVSGVHGQGGEDRIDPFVEERPEPCDLLRGEVAPPQNLDPRGGEGRKDLVTEGLRMLVDEFVRSLRDAVQAFPRSRPQGVLRGDAGRHPPVQCGHADHQELVQVARADRNEPQALEDGHPLVLRQLEDAGVEVHPARLTVEEPVGRQLSVGQRQDRDELLDLLGAVIGKPAGVRLGLRGEAFSEGTHGEPSSAVLGTSEWGGR
jgi:hypothetical protein